MTTVFVDTRSDAEKRYDSMRDGSAYVKPTRPRLAAYAASPEVVAVYNTLSLGAQRLVDRLVAAVDRMPDDDADRAIDQVLLTLDDLAAARTPEIEVTYLYRANEGSDLTDQPIGPVAYTDYTLGTEDTRALISFDAKGAALCEIIMQGRYVETPIEAHLANMEQAITNMRALLADPRVQALRAKQ